MYKKYNSSFQERIRLFEAMRNEEFIKNKEYYKTTLNKIIKFIKSCDKSLNRMCCGYCLKCYNFDKIKLHKCKYIT